MIFQNPRVALNPIRTVERQIADVLKAHGKGTDTKRASAWRCSRPCASATRSQRLQAYPHELSGGMCQRVMIAMAIACEPALLIADEPTTGLDVTTQQTVMELLAAIQAKRDMAMILITHDLGLAARWCDRIAVMEQGRVVETGRTTALFEAPQHPYTQRLVAASPTRRSTLASLTPEPPTPFPQHSPASGKALLLELTNVVKTFDATKAVDDVSFRIASAFAADAVLLKLLGVHPVVVHGGGPQISRMLQRAGVESTFIDGLRVTDPAHHGGGGNGAVRLHSTKTWSITLTAPARCGRAGRRPQRQGCPADHRHQGAPHQERALTRRRRRCWTSASWANLKACRSADSLRLLMAADQDYVPVIALRSASRKRATPTTSTPTRWRAPWPALLKAKRMLLLTDVRGVLDKDGQLIRSLTVSEAFEMIREGVATGGMIPKLETAIAAVDGGVEAVVIMDGRRPHAMLLELFTEHGAGTLIKA